MVEHSAFWNNDSKQMSSEGNFVHIKNSKRLNNGTECVVFINTPMLHVWTKWWQAEHDWLKQQEICSWQHFSLKGSGSAGSLCLYISVTNVANSQWSLEDFGGSRPITFNKWTLARHVRTHSETCRQTSLGFPGTQLQMIMKSTPIRRILAAYTHWHEGT